MITPAIQQSIEGDAAKAARNPTFDQWDVPFKPGDAFANAARKLWIDAFKAKRTAAK